MSGTFLENDFSQAISLDGFWQFALAGHPPREICVPSAWEASDGDKITEGPAVYRRTVELVQAPATGERWLLECDAISFAAFVRVNGRVAGEHHGLWTRFQLDVTALLRAGENAIEVVVWKPGVGRYKLRESLAGFLPDVCNTFGGIWQGMRLRRLQGAAIADLRVVADGRGVVRAAGRIAGIVAMSQDASLRIDALAATAPLTIGRDGSFRATLRTAGAERWSPVAPRMYDAVIDAGGARATRRLGFREVRARGATTLLNGAPAHFRGVLDWGWDECRLCPTASRDEVRDAFAKIRSLGFNLFKLCLFVPDEVTFDVADEQGMLLWLELPMWLPRVTEAFKALALREYEGILRRVHHHPSIAIVSLGCELDAEADAAFLAELRALVRRYMPNALLCDNSGSSEAYGGATHAGDFYDYHFYAEPHDFQALNAHFARAYLPAKPWIYGEFCDADTMRDWSQLSPKPFWATPRGAVTMQRDELIWAREHEARLRAAGVADGGAEITSLGRAQATAVRKFILERTRLNHATGGYVLTGWRDTPIATSGVVDDRGALKFDPQVWRCFNADRVLVMDRERRRRWTHGGDRPVYRDPCAWWADEPIEAHIALSNGGEAIDDARLDWDLVSAKGGSVIRGSRSAISVGAGAIAELTIAQARVEVYQPQRFMLRAELSAGDDCVARNAWPVWVMPRFDIEALARSPALASTLHADVLAAAWSGERRVVWLREFDVGSCVWRPFVREAVHCVYDAKLNAYANDAWFAVATDFALDATRLAARLAVAPHAVTPLWRRFDARAMTSSDYVIDVALGAGLLRVTTLRFAGGLGQQPAMLHDNPLGAWCLAKLLQFD